MHTKDDGGGDSYHKYVYIQGNIYLYYRVDIAFFVCLHIRSPPKSPKKCTKERGCFRWNVTKIQFFQKNCKKFAKSFPFCSPAALS